MELFAHIGIAVLLFIVGLKLDLNLIRTTGPVAVAAGLGQVLLTSAMGLAMALLMGMDAVGAAYVSVAITFSSTIIIVKLLSDKKEIDSLHGGIALGLLIMQDMRPSSRSSGSPPSTRAEAPRRPRTSPWR